MNVFSEAEEYDFIVVGAGASGSVVASRLSEEPKWKVLLLEAGEEENCVTQIPVMHRQLQRTPYAWGYWTVPQNTTCLGNFHCFSLLIMYHPVNFRQIYNNISNFEVWRITNVILRKVKV